LRAATGHPAVADRPSELSRYNAEPKHGDRRGLERLGPRPEGKYATNPRSHRTNAEHQSLNSKPGCIKVVDTFRDAIDGIAGRQNTGTHNLQSHGPCHFEHDTASSLRTDVRPARRWQRRLAITPLARKQALRFPNWTASRSDTIINPTTLHAPALEAALEPLAGTLMLRGVETWLRTRFHPDKYPDANPEQLKLLNDATKKINAVYTATKRNRAASADKPD
jgi:hypothetical protein